MIQKSSLGENRALSQSAEGGQSETNHFRPGKEARPQRIAALQRYGQSEYGTA